MNKRTHLLAVFELHVIITFLPELHAVQVPVSLISCLCVNNK